MQEITSANILTSMPALRLTLRLTAQGETAPLAQAHDALGKLIRTAPFESKPSLEMALTNCLDQITLPRQDTSTDNCHSTDPGEKLVEASRQLPPAQAKLFVQQLFACLLGVRGFRTDGRPDLEVQTTYVKSIATTEAVDRYAKALRDMGDESRLEPGSRFSDKATLTLIQDGKPVEIPLATESSRQAQTLAQIAKLLTNPSGNEKHGSMATWMRELGLDTPEVRACAVGQKDSPAGGDAVAAVDKQGGLHEMGRRAFAKLYGLAHPTENQTIPSAEAASRKAALIAMCHLGYPGEINDRNHLGDTALLGFAALNSPHAARIVEALLKHPDIDVNALDNMPQVERPPLLWAVKYGHADTVKMLCQDKRVALDAVDARGQNILHCVKNVATLEYLLGLEGIRTILNAQDKSGNTPLDKALQNKKNEQLAEMLSRAGAKPSDPKKQLDHTNFFG